MLQLHAEQASIFQLVAHNVYFPQGYDQLLSYGATYHQADHFASHAFFASNAFCASNAF